MDYSFTFPSFVQYGKRLHSIGLYFLFKRRDVADTQVQYWLLLTLSTIEFAYSFIQVLLSALSFNLFVTPDFYIYICVYGGVFFLYTFVMTIILLDRLLEVRLNLQYELFCTVPRVKRTIVGCIVASVIFTFAAVLLLDKTFTALYEFLALYLWPCIAFFYLSTSILVYGFIFFKIRSLHQLRVHLEHVVLTNIRWDLRSKKKLFLPSLLIFSFIGCWVVPALLTLVNHVFKLNFGIAVWIVLHAFMVIGLCFDAVAYVIFYKPIRVYIRRLMRIVASRVAPLWSFATSNLYPWKHLRHLGNILNLYLNLNSTRCVKCVFHLFSIFSVVIVSSYHLCDGWIRTFNKFSRWCKTCLEYWKTFIEQSSMCY